MTPGMLYGLGEGDFGDVEHPLGQRPFSPNALKKRRLLRCSSFANAFSAVVFALSFTTMTKRSAVPSPLMS